MSIPKTVYTVGEDIPVSYYAKGSVAAKSPVKESGNLPWIGMYAHNTSSNPSTKEEIEAGRYYIQPDSSGVKYISTANLTPGVYQIYLRDNSALLFHGDPYRYWWEYDMVDPITIVITNAANPVTNPIFEYKFSNFPNKKFDNKTIGLVSGTVKLINPTDLSTVDNIFYQGDTISVDIKFTQGNNEANYWLALYPEGGENGSYPTWRSSNSTGTYTLKTKNITKGANQAETPSGTYTLPAGKYTLYLLNGGDYVDAYKNGRIYAVMDITILPSTMKTAFGGATQIHSLGTNEQGKVIEITQDWTPTIVSDPFSYYTVSGTFTATQQDVERGYVMFEYDFTGLGSSVDLSFVIDNFTVTKRESS